MKLSKKDIILKENNNNVFEDLVISNIETKFISVSFESKTLSNQTYLNINDFIKVLLGDKIILEVNTPQLLKMSLIVDTETNEDYEFDINIEEFEKKPDNSFDFPRADVLVVTDKYSNIICDENELLHRINKTYEQNGINLQVACINDVEWFETEYTYDNIEVIKGNTVTLKELLMTQKYKTLIFDNANINHLWLIAGYTNPNQNIVFRVTNNELLEDDFIVSNYYFTKKQKPSEDLIIEKNSLMNTYSQKDNILWIFDSKTLKEEFEKKYKLKNSLVSDIYFECPTAKVKKKNDIIIINSFTNNAKYGIDDCVRTILELSRKKGFSQNNIHIYGTGDYYETLIEPIKNYKNVMFYRSNIFEKEKNNKMAECKYLLNCSQVSINANDINMALNNNLTILTTNCNYNYKVKNVLKFNNYIDICNYIVDNNSNKYTYNSEIKKFNIEEEIKYIKNTLKKNNEYPDYKKSTNPVLTIAIPCYNVEKYLAKCLNSLIFTKNINKLEVLVINDGSSDSTHEIGKKYEELTDGIIKIIDKENGGHGSAVNLGMKLAKGKYFKILDSDDWFDCNSLEKLIDYLEKSHADLVLNKVCRDYLPDYHLDIITEYDYLVPKITYNFEDLILENYGLSSPLIFAACVYKTKTLRKANFTITEKKLYADHELDSLMLKYIKTIEYYPINVYMYLVGRQGQSISSSVWEKRYKDHQSAIFTLLDKLENDNEFPSNRIEFISRINLFPMVEHQINTMLDLKKENEILPFLQNLSKYKNEYSIIKKELLNNNDIDTNVENYLNSDDILNYHIKGKSLLKKMLKKVNLC